MANWTYDPSQYEERNFETIPPGDYRLRITDVVEKNFKSGNAGYEFTLDVNGYNSKVWFYLVLDPSNPQQTNQRIGDFFDSFGITNHAMGSGRQWIGTVGAGRIKHEEYMGKTFAKVAYLISRKKQDKLPPWQGSTVQQGRPAMSSMGNIPSVSPDDLPFDM